jgi:uncharacterized damage-inducible protein DinB
MSVEEIRELFAYDRWATERLLRALDGIDEETWTRSEVIDQRGLGGVLVHMLGAYQRWLHGLAEDGGEWRPERGPLPSTTELREMWEIEWPAMDALLGSVEEAWLRRDDEGVTFDWMLRHLANHDTQHRAEAAVLLSQAGRSPGDLDLIVWLEDRAGWRDGIPPSQQGRET